MSEDWITTTEAAEISDYHPVHIRRLLLEGKITGKKWGTQWQVSRTSVERYLTKVDAKGKRRGPKPKK